MHFKEFPESRICVIDFKPVLLKAIKNAQGFCKKSNLIFDLKNKDIKKLLSHFIINDFCSVYSRTKTSYIKIFGVYKTDINEEYQKIFDKILSVLPIPYCVIENMDHPDTKYAAINKINQDKNNYRQLKRFANNNGLTKLQENLTKQNIFFGGTVDFSRSLE
jgi:hypothetical protein